MASPSTEQHDMARAGIKPAPTTFRGEMRADARGLTVIELLISMLLAAILIAGLMYMVAGQRATYGDQLNAVTLQDTLRGAMEYLQREVRMAGYGFGGCPGGRAKQWTGTGGNSEDSPFLALRVYNACNLLTTGPTACPTGGTYASDSLTVTALTGSPAIGGMAALRMSGPIADSLPGNDILLLQPGNFAANDLVLLWDPAIVTKECMILQVTGVVAGTPTLIQHAAGGSYNPATDMFAGGGAAGGFPARSFAVRIGSVVKPRHFAVDPTTNPPRLVTWTTRAANPSTDTADLEVVAEGIEDMQLSGGCDANNDGAFNEGTDQAGDPRTQDEYSNNVAADVVPVCGTRPVAAIRITLVGRSAGPQMGMRTGFRPAAEDNTAGTSAEDLAATGGVGTYTRSVARTLVYSPNLRH